MVTSRVTPHVETDGCAGTHCSTHNVDEVGDGYIVCTECGHLYPTARSLRRAYRRRLRQDPPRLYETEYTYGLFTWLRLYLTVRADRITFCQECSHDF